MPSTLERAQFFVKMYTFDMHVTHLAPSRTEEGPLVEVHSGMYLLGFYICASDITQILRNIFGSNKIQNLL
jgi:hypothetical protein